MSATVAPARMVGATVTDVVVLHVSPLMTITSGLAAAAVAALSRPGSRRR